MWDKQSGDGNHFDGNLKTIGLKTGIDETTPELQQISQDLSRKILGNSAFMTTGYAYDVSDGGEYNGNTRSHAGIDYKAEVDREVFAIVPGKIIHISDNNPGKFITVESEDGKRWLYGHVNSSISQKDLQEKDYFLKEGELVGTVVYQAREGKETTHFHVEVHTPPFDANSIGGILYQTDGEFKSVLSRTISPLQAYWEWRNQIAAKAISSTI
jgi:murein DD-endopeptidase MepM/ murein hydrolase activator NlpD